MISYSKHNRVDCPHAANNAADALDSRLSLHMSDKVNLSGDGRSCIAAWTPAVNGKRAVKSGVSVGTTYLRSTWLEILQR